MTIINEQLSMNNDQCPAPPYNTGIELIIINDLVGDALAPSRDNKYVGTGRDLSDIKDKMNQFKSRKQIRLKGHDWLLFYYRLF